MLGCNDGLDDGGKVVDVGKGFDAEEDVVERSFDGLCGFFG